MRAAREPTPAIARDQRAPERGRDRPLLPPDVDGQADRALVLWQHRARTVAADGARLPFGDASCDLVISDNVIDHARDPRGIVDELVRVLAPGGLLYFTVNVHDPLYDAVSRAHGALTALGAPVEIGPFADHTVHLTPRAAWHLVDRPELEVLESGISRGPASPTHPLAVRAILATFPKNHLFEVIARRTYAPAC